jgi:hypothetical protein
MDFAQAAGLASLLPAPGAGLDTGAGAGAGDYVSFIQDHRDGLVEDHR